MSANTPDQPVAVKDLLGKYTVEELNVTADEYFKQFTSLEGILAKPFVDLGESTEVLLTFCHVLRGLDATRGMTILDFGAGSCWSSRYMTQLGYKVIAVDVSETALNIGREGYRRQPPFGDCFAPVFSVFDGHTLDVPDKSVDRIMCLSAFHHVPNQAKVLREFARVLKDGGTAGFSEPGPNHSLSAQSQHEMKHFKVIENDILIEEEVWPAAQEAGFISIHIGIWTPMMTLTSIEGYNRYLQPNAIDPVHEVNTKNLLRERRLFFLRKGWKNKRGEWNLDSSQSSGLKCEIHLSRHLITATAGEPITLTVDVKNIGEAVWLPSTAQAGPVRLGTVLRNEIGQVIASGRYPLPGDPAAYVMPGDSVSYYITVPAISSVGKYVLDFDMVSDGVCWFAINGTPPRSLFITVQGLAPEG